MTNEPSVTTSIADPAVLAGISIKSLGGQTARISYAGTGGRSKPIQPLPAMLYLALAQSPGVYVPRRTIVERIYAIAAEHGLSTERYQGEPSLRKALEKLISALKNVEAPIHLQRARSRVGLDSNPFRVVTTSAPPFRIPGLGADPVNLAFTYQGTSCQTASINLYLFQREMFSSRLPVRWDTLDANVFGQETVHKSRGLLLIEGRDLLNTLGIEALLEGGRTGAYLMERPGLFVEAGGTLRVKPGSKSITDGDLTIEAPPSVRESAVVALGALIAQMGKFMPFRDLIEKAWGARGSQNRKAKDQLEALMEHFGPVMTNNHVELEFVRGEVRAVRRQELDLQTNPALHSSGASTVLLQPTGGSGRPATFLSM